jgi:UDP-N-acetylmuramoyl-L-alanyl-D-glutamate--2,6-diaminopimelate ligase
MLQSVFRSWWHGMRAFFTAASLGFPARNMIVIGITGTKGKTTTTVFTGRLLNALGIKTGYISTALLYLGTGEEFQNPYKMTTIDPVLLQKYIKTMQYVGCKVVVLEMSSQGLESNRHLGLFGFSISAFLNLTPEHLDAHGSLENYVRSKSLLFKSLRPGGVAIVNDDSQYSSDMLGAIPPRIQPLVKQELVPLSRDCVPVLQSDQYTYGISHRGDVYSTQFFAPVEVLDFYWASVISHSALQLLGQEVSLGSLLTKSSEVSGVPGRMEFAAHSAFADALVDYAHEPESMQQLLSLVSEWRERGLYQHVIHVVSCDGVGRDDWKKSQLGQISHQYADFTYITTDNYGVGDDPQAIVDMIASDLPPQDFNKSIFLHVNRKQAMEFAFSRAKILPGRTLIVSTGVGNEFGIQQPSGKLEWSEVGVWKQIFKSKGRVR